MPSRKFQKLWNIVWENLDLFILMLAGLAFAILPSIAIQKSFFQKVDRFYGRLWRNKTPDILRQPNEQHRKRKTIQNCASAKNAQEI